MESVVDERLKAEVARFRLRFSCDDCVHFDPGAGCSQGFPSSEHRASSLEGRRSVVFCKMFEAS